MYNCISEPELNLILGSLLCVGGIVSYIPQIYSLIKSKHSEGISELSLLILCLGSAFLSGNAVILNWERFNCYNHCGFWLCTGKLLSVFQIFIGWVMVLPIYLIFLRFKIRESDRRIIYDLKYALIYVVTILVMVIVGVSEKTSSANSNKFFHISAKILGILSAICSCIVWLPQIIKLIKTRNPGNLSLPMFIMQTPGNAIVILLQILYKQSWTTWFTYVVTLVEQSIIVVLLIIFKCGYGNSEEIYPINSSEFDQNIDEFV